MALQTSGIDLVPRAVWDVPEGLGVCGRNEGIFQAHVAPHALLTTCFVPPAARHCRTPWPSVLLHECFSREFAPPVHPSEVSGKTSHTPVLISSTKSVLAILLKTFLNSCFTIGNTHPLPYKEKDRLAILLDVFLEGKVTAAWG